MATVAAHDGRVAEPSAPLPPDYWELARQPLNSLCFLLPLLVAYEVGVLCLGGNEPEALRNGADCWMRTVFQRSGCDFGWLLPLLVAGSLLAWHAGSRQPWTVSPDTWIGMLAESFLFAFALVVFGQVQGMLFEPWQPVPMELSPAVVRSVSYLGAGIYEEVLFRLFLIPVCYGVWRVLLLPHVAAAGMAVLLSSLLFAAAHYVGPTGDSFTPFTFTFRACAGVFFALLFVLRGFGVAAGTHAAYDLLVGVLLVN